VFLQEKSDKKVAVAKFTSGAIEPHQIPCEYARRDTQKGSRMFAGRPL
jgi:hypothetical protein